MHRYSGTLRSLIGKIKHDNTLVLFSQILDGVEAAHLTKVWHSVGNNHPALKYNNLNARRTGNTTDLTVRTALH
jgi:hypothetical protein